MILKVTSVEKQTLINSHTRYISLVSKRIFSTLLKRHKPHYVHATFRKLLLSSSGEHTFSYKNRHTS